MGSEIPRSGRGFFWFLDWFPGWKLHMIYPIYELRQARRKVHIWEVWQVLLEGENIVVYVFLLLFLAFLHIRLVWFSALGFELFSFFCTIYWKSVYC
jgi:hypothetical protein